MNHGVELTLKSANSVFGREIFKNTNEKYAIFEAFAYCKVKLYDVVLHFQQYYLK